MAPTPNEDLLSAFDEAPVAQGNDLLGAFDEAPTITPQQLAELQAIHEEGLRSSRIDPRPVSDMVQQAMAAQSFGQESPGMWQMAGEGLQSVGQGLYDIVDTPIRFGKEYLGTFDNGEVYNPLTGMTSDVNLTTNEQMYGPGQWSFPGSYIETALSPIDPARIGLAGQRTVGGIWNDMSAGIQADPSAVGGQIGGEMGAAYAVGTAEQVLKRLPAGKAPAQLLAYAKPAVQAVVGIAAKEFLDDDDVAQEDPGFLRQVYNRTLQLYAQKAGGKGIEMLGSKMSGSIQSAPEAASELIKGAKKEVAGVKPVHQTRVGRGVPFKKSPTARPMSEQLGALKERAQKIASGSSDPADWRTNAAFETLERAGFYRQPIRSYDDSMKRLERMAKRAEKQRQDVYKQLPDRDDLVWKQAAQGKRQEVVPATKHPVLEDQIKAAKTEGNFDLLDELEIVKKDIEFALSPSRDARQIQGAIDSGFITAEQAKKFRETKQTFLVNDPRKTTGFSGPLKNKPLTIEDIKDPRLKGALSLTEISQVAGDAGDLRPVGTTRIEATFPPAAIPPVYKPLDKLARMRTEFGAMADKTFVNQPDMKADLKVKVANQAYQWTTQLMEDYAYKLIKAGKMTEAQWQTLNESYDVIAAQKMLGKPLQVRASLESLPFYDTTTIQGPSMRQRLGRKLTEPMTRGIVNNPGVVQGAYNTAYGAADLAGRAVEPIGKFAQNPYVMAGQLAMDEKGDVLFPRTSEQFFSLPDEILQEYFPDKMPDIQKLRTADPSKKHDALRMWADEPGVADLFKPSAPGLEQYNLIDGVMTAESAMRADQDLKELMAQPGADKLRIANLRKAINANRPILEMARGHAPISGELADQILLSDDEEGPVPGVAENIANN